MKTYLGLLIVLIIGLTASLAVTWGYTDPGYINVQPTSDGFRTQSVPNLPNFEFQEPDWFQPTSLAQAPENLSYRKNEVLPYEEHRYAERYLVIPTMGMVVPIVDIAYGSQDYESMKFGQEIDIQKYLQNGVIRFPQSGEPGQEGNMFIFGHSNGLKKRPGEFNAVFAKAMGLEAGVDQVWVYDKRNNGEYELFKYNVTRSYETVPSNVDVMLWDGEGADLTLSMCTNKLAGRWIVKAELVDEWADITPRIRTAIDSAIKKIKRLPEKEQTAAIVYFFNKLDKAKKNGWISTSEQELIVDYLEEQLAAVFPGGYASNS